MHEALDTRPWALLVTRNFPPLVGGMEKVNRYLLASLASEWRVALCGPRGCRQFAPRNSVVSEAAIRPLPMFLLSSAARALYLACKKRPRLVVAGSGLTAPIAWLAARITGARAGVYLHGLDVIAPSWIYQRSWLPFIRACDLVIVNSENTARLARGRGIAGERIAVLHPGTDIPDLDPAAGAAFRAQYGLTQPILLSVGRLTRRKGLAEFVANALPGIVSRRPGVLLMVIGEEARDALHGASSSERERIAAAALAAGVQENLRFLGRCEEATLRAAYQAADCHVFPVLDTRGDVEGFGMVALESAAHGLPTVAFAVGGVPDAVAEGRSGTLVDAGDYAMLRDAVIAILDQPRNESTINACREFAADKSWHRFGERLRQLVRAMHDKDHPHE